MATLIGMSSHLHTSMCFSLFSSSFIDLSYSSVFIPKMLVTFISKNNIISSMGFMTQLNFLCFFGLSEISVLTSMAYVAICNPLLYNAVVSPKVCSSLVLGSYLMAFSGAMAHTLCWHWLSVMQISSAIFSVTCSLFSALLYNYHINKLVLFIVMGINIIVPSLTIFIFYGLIFSSILHIKSMEGISKALSICSSHIIAVSLFFGSGAFVYLKPSSAGSKDEGKISSVFYTNTVPLLYPLIYSLRNKDIILALKNTLSMR